jgi:hypothetical protein
MSTAIGISGSEMGIPAEAGWSIIAGVIELPNVQVYRGRTGFDRIG